MDVARPVVESKTATTLSRLVTSPFRTASPADGSETTWYNERARNSRMTAPVSFCSTRYREVLFTKAGIAMVCRFAGSAVPCPPTWYPQPLRVAASTIDTRDSALWRTRAFIELDSELRNFQSPIITLN